MTDITVKLSQKGVQGAAGSVWRNGSGAPSNTIGVNGDYYLDNVSGNVYYKESGAYVLIANITGPETNITGAPIIQSVFLTDYAVIVRNGVIYLATIANVLAATAPANVFTGEDGSTVFTGEDGTTPFNQES